MSKCVKNKMTVNSGLYWLMILLSTVFLIACSPSEQNKSQTAMDKKERSTLFGLTVGAPLTLPYCKNESQYFKNIFFHQESELINYAKVLTTNCHIDASSSSRDSRRIYVFLPENAHDLPEFATRYYRGAPIIEVTISSDTQRIIEHLWIITVYEDSEAVVNYLNKKYGEPSSIEHRPASEEEQEMKTTYEWAGDDYRFYFMANPNITGDSYIYFK